MIKRLLTASLAFLSVLVLFHAFDAFALTSDFGKQHSTKVPGALCKKDTLKEGYEIASSSNEKDCQKKSCEVLVKPAW